MDRSQFSSMIEEYERGAAVPSTWARGLSAKELNTPPPTGAPGKWTIQQIILHVLDSDLIATHRMKRIIAEENPLLISYDETAFAARLNYEKLDAAQAAELFRLNRLHTAAILRALPESVLDRSGVHNERGKVTLADMLQMYVQHVPHHGKFVEAKRQLMGKPSAA